jgi:hypothetical protein
MSFRTRRFLQAVRNLLLISNRPRVPHPRFSRWGFSSDLATHFRRRPSPVIPTEAARPFLSSFARANEPRREVEESLFDLSRSQLILFCLKKSTPAA